MTVACTLVGLSLPVLEQEAIGLNRQAPTSLPDPEDDFVGTEISRCVTPALFAAFPEVKPAAGGRDTPTIEGKDGPCIGDAEALSGRLELYDYNP